MYFETKSLNVSCTVSIFCWKEIDIWVGFGPVSSIEKTIGPIISKFWGQFFHVFIIKLLFRKKTHYSVRTKKLHNISFVKIFLDFCRFLFCSTRDTLPRDLCIIILFRNDPKGFLLSDPVTSHIKFRFSEETDLLWEKIILVIEKNFWSSRLKAKNLQKIWDHLNNLFKQWKVRTIFAIRMLF